MKSGTLSMLPMSVNMRITASLAPPWRGPYSAAAAAAGAEYGSECDEPTTRMAVVEQFCSWSAWRMTRTSRARVKMGLGSKWGSATFHIIDRKLEQKSRELSG